MSQVRRGCTASIPIGLIRYSHFKPVAAGVWPQVVEKKQNSRMMQSDSLHKGCFMWVKIAVYTILAKGCNMLSQLTMLIGWVGIGILNCLRNHDF
jgi:hypothetical protein